MMYRSLYFNVLYQTLCEDIRVQENGIIIFIYSTLENLPVDFKKVFSDQQPIDYYR